MSNVSTQAPLPAYITPSANADYVYDSSTGSVTVTNGTLTVNTDPPSDTADPNVTSLKFTANGPTAKIILNTDQITPASVATLNGGTVVVAAPILVGSPVINGDNPNGLLNAAGQPTPGVQRSMVEDVVYTFSAPVSIPDAEAAFTLVGAGPNPGTVPATLTAAAVPGSNGTQWAVTLTGGAAGVLGSIANGEYSITINPAGVFAAADGVTQLVAGRADKFYRLYGDINGKEVVNALDNLALKKAIATYNPAFDSNGDGAVNALDNLAFKKDLTVAYFGDGFVPSI